MMERVGGNGEVRMIWREGLKASEMAALGQESQIVSTSVRVSMGGEFPEQKLQSQGQGTPQKPYEGDPHLFLHCFFCRELGICGRLQPFWYPWKVSAVQSFIMWWCSIKFGA